MSKSLKEQMPKSTLQIASGLSLPLNAATQTFAFIARKGAGKTYTAGKLVELLLEAGVQVVVLDTVGNWYGLRLGVDGKASAFDVPVLGGLRGDIPLEATSGALIADIVVDTGRSMVLDASQFSKADRQRFAAAFGERLWLRKKGEREPSPVHLVIEESQLIVPQDVRGDTAHMVGVYEEIIRLGRNYGIGVSMITQRPQSVNKEVLNQTECLFVGQINGAQERDALKKWITHQGMDTHLVDELPTLKVGTFYVWSPQWLELLEKVQILPKRTLDASATPTVGGKRVQRDLKPLDLTALQSQMAETIERAKADDPRELKKRIAELERQVKTPAPAAAVPGKTVEILTDADRERLTALRGELAAFRAEVDALVSRSVDNIQRAIEGALSSAIDQVTSQHAHKAALAAGRLEKAGFTRILEKLDRVIVAPASINGRAYTAPSRIIGNAPIYKRPLQKPQQNTRTDAKVGFAESGLKLEPAKQRLLNSLAWLSQLGRTSWPREVVGFVAGASSRSSAFANNLSALRTAGLLDYPQQNQLALTEAGAGMAAPPDAVLTPADLHAQIERLLEPAQWRLAKAVIESYPKVLTREQLADAAGASSASSAFANNISRLRTLGLLDYPRQGEVVGTPILFLEA